MSRFIFTTLLILFVQGAVFAEKTNLCMENQRCFLKLGATLPPSARYPLPTMGIALRTQKGKFGWDFSLNAASLVFSNLFSLKAVAINYAKMSSDRYFYAGCGLGIAHATSISLMGGPLVGTSAGVTFGTLEGVLGYQFPLLGQFVGSWQIELSLPVVSSQTPHFISSYPGCSLIFGIGF